MKNNLNLSCTVVEHDLNMNNESLRFTDKRDLNYYQNFSNIYRNIFFVYT